MGKIFVTGATGFIGQRLLFRLEAYGKEILVLSRREYLQHETFICDLLRDSVPDHALNGVDTVFHLAGYTHDMKNEFEVAERYRLVNVNSTVHLAELSVIAGVKNFVFVSSVKAGGRAVLGQCVTEDEQGQPEGIYGRTKREAELKVLDIGQQSGMHVSIVRPSLVYGPGVKGNLALMQSGIQSGWFPPLPETNNRRSMIHVDDLVRAIVFAAESDQANGEILIATDGVPHSSREIYEAICHSVGKVPHSWSVPKLVFDLVGTMSSKVRFNLDKLLGDECYSSAKLEAFGFQTEKGLIDLARSDFDMNSDNRTEDHVGNHQTIPEDLHSS